MHDPFKYFRVEARELSDDLVSGILALERGQPNAPAVAGLLRSAHTLKGAARVVKHADIADRAHALEGALEPFRVSTNDIGEEDMAKLLAIVDGIADLVKGIAPPPSPPAAGSAAAVAASTESPPDSFALSSMDTLPRTVRVNLEEMDGLVDGVREAHSQLSRLRSYAAASEHARSLADLLAQQLAPRSRDRSGARPETAMATGRSIALELSGLLAHIERRLVDATVQIDRELGQLRESAERLRLVPASVLFTDLERAVRDVAKEQRKRVRFVASGGDIRLDAHVVASMQAALHQIVRNAVAHGIETEHDRHSAGKPADGLINLDVECRGGRVVFTCTDDGRGVDLVAVRAAAERRGLISEAAADVGPQALINMLLEGGISTSDTVTEVAGRGIGLDVVRESAAGLGAHVRVITEPGSGTTVEFDTPLSLFAVDALIARSDGSTVAIPVESVVCVVRITRDEIASTSQGEALIHGGKPVPLLALASVLSRDNTDRGEARLGRSVVVVKGSTGVAAIEVDRLLGSSNVVIRPLPEGMAADVIVAGAWLDADGNPQLVLDPDGLVVAAHQATGRGDAPSRPAPILVIDDSLTTRMLERSILEAAGYDVELAASAEEGLINASAAPHSLFLVDIEMPGMDGFTFVERIRADPDLHEVPCILVSSRASAEDRRRGMAAGAHAYMAKGEFDQGVLLGTIRSLVGG